MVMIGYVSIPFGKKRGVDFTKIFERAIYTAPSAPSTESAQRTRVFREDSKMPKLENRHETRLERFGLIKAPAETQLREEIQKHIVLADFVIADISQNNPNVLLEVGFAQGLRKRIIYLTQNFNAIPSNLGNLKRLEIYDPTNLDQLRYNLSVKINEVVSEVENEQQQELERGGNLEYFQNRQLIPLHEHFAGAQRVIQILTTNLTTVSANFIDPIVAAIQRARAERRRLEVTILTSDPSNRYIHPRAAQLEENQEGYRDEIQGSLKAIAGKLEGAPNCSLLTYDDFPVQLWHRIDGTLYVGNSSLLRRTHHNSVFSVSVDVPGIQDTFLDHFEELMSRSKEYPPSTPAPRGTTRGAKKKGVSKRARGSRKRSKKGGKRTNSSK